MDNYDPSEGFEDGKWFEHDLQISLAATATHDYWASALSFASNTIPTETVTHLVEALTWKETQQDACMLRRATDEYAYTWVPDSQEPTDELREQAADAARVLAAVHLAINCKASGHPMYTEQAAIPWDYPSAFPDVSLTHEEQAQVDLACNEGTESRFYRAFVTRSQRKYHRALRSQDADWFANDRRRANGFAGLRIAPSLPNSKRFRTKQAAHTEAGRFGA